MFGGGTHDSARLVMGWAGRPYQVLVLGHSEVTRSMISNTVNVIRNMETSVHFVTQFSWFT